jgi:hypothetical protein
MNAFPLLKTEPLSPEANHRIFTALAREMTRDTSVASDGGAELVEDATISYLQRDESAARGHRRPLLLALVAVAAAVLGVGILARDNSDRTRTGTEVTPETMPIYLPTVLPDGFTFSTGNDYTNRTSPPFRDQVYRDPSKPIGARAVQITTTPLSVWGGMPSGHPIIIQGRPGFDESDRGLPALRLTDGQVSIHVGGRGVSYAEIEQIAGSARAASTDPADGAVVSFLPDGLRLVLDQATRPPNRNITATYAPAEDNGLHQLDVNIWPASSMNLDQWAVGRPGELAQTTVRGHDALSVASDQNSSVVWSETRGVLIEVNGLGIPADQVRQAAESLRRVGSNKWANLRESKGIAIQDDGAPGSPGTIAEPTTAANPVDRVEAWTMPLLVPQLTGNVAQLNSAEDRTIQPNFDGPIPFSQRLIYREAGTAPGSRAVQIELFRSTPAAPNPSSGAVAGQAPFTEEVSEQILRINGIDPNGLHFRLSGRGFTQSQLEAIAKSVTATWTGDRTNVSSLVPGFTEVENRSTSISQYRSTKLDYGSVSVSMNPIGSGTIESYAIETPGSFTATKVRGHDGYVVTDPATNTLRLVWVEAPGLLVEVKGISADVATMQRIAESLQPVSTDAWKKLLATVNAKPETVKAP